MGKPPKPATPPAEPRVLHGANCQCLACRADRHARRVERLRLAKPSRPRAGKP